MQYKACQLVKKRKFKKDKQISLIKAVNIHSSILLLIKSYEALNMVDEALTSKQKI